MANFRFATLLVGGSVLMAVAFTVWMRFVVEHVSDYWLGLIATVAPPMIILWCILAFTKSNEHPKRGVKHE